MTTPLAELTERGTTEILRNVIAAEVTGVWIGRRRGATWIWR